MRAFTQAEKSAVNSIDAQFREMVDGGLVNRFAAEQLEQGSNRPKSTGKSPLPAKRPRRGAESHGEIQSGERSKGPVPAAVLYFP
ncbi:hypothetical protein [Oxalobacter paraformigenes]|uniref:hypothetical protein n=1 Tax=Oxalobacter paraformigenes TaxID=556268 RepID=UPI0002EDB12B|nr:hypothetical protein [Oxalobacter paraformigenes]